MPSAKSSSGPFVGRRPSTAPGGGESKPKHDRPMPTRRPDLRVLLPPDCCDPPHCERASDAALYKSTTRSDDPEPSDSRPERAGLHPLPTGPTPPREGAQAFPEGEQSRAPSQVATAKCRACGCNARDRYGLAPSGVRHPHRPVSSASAPLVSPAMGPLFSPAVGLLFSPAAGPWARADAPLFSPGGPALLHARFASNRPTLLACNGPALFACDVPALCLSAVVPLFRLQ